MALQRNLGPARRSEIRSVWYLGWYLDIDDLHADRRPDSSLAAPHESSTGALGGLVERVVPEPGVRTPALPGLRRKSRVHGKAPGGTIALAGTLSVDASTSPLSDAERQT